MKTEIQTKYNKIEEVKAFKLEKEQWKIDGVFHNHQKLKCYIAILNFF